MSATIKNHAHLTVPEHDGPWCVLLWHPLKDMPLSMQITDAEADAFARDHAPAGWALSGAAVQGRDQFNRRVIQATFVRHDASRDSNGKAAPLARRGSISAGNGIGDAVHACDYQGCHICCDDLGGGS